MMRAVKLTGREKKALQRRTSSARGGLKRREGEGAICWRIMNLCTRACVPGTRATTNHTVNTNKYYTPLASVLDLAAIEGEEEEEE